MGIEEKAKGWRHREGRRSLAGDMMLSWRSEVVEENILDLKRKRLYTAVENAGLEEGAKIWEN